MSPVDESLFDRDVEIIKKRHGPDSIHSGDQMIEVERIPVDSPGLMRITSGPGLDGEMSAGVPIGHIIRLYGDTSTGKTRIAYMMAAAAQRYRSKRFPHGLSLCLWNVEQTYDPVFARKCGIDTSKIHIMGQQVIEDIAEGMELMLASRHVHVIDSASFATPAEELAGAKKDPSGAAYQVQVGAHSRAWKRAINRIHTRMSDENIVIIVDHMGQNIKTQSMQPLSGRRIGYRSDLSILLKRGPWLFYNKSGRLESNDKIKEEEGQGPAGMKEADGLEASVRVEKSRVCRPLRACKLRLDLNTSQYDHVWELADSATYYDEDGEPAHRSGKPPLIPKTTNGYYRAPGYEKAAHGFDEWYRMLVEDKFLQDQIRRMMLGGK